MTTDILLFLRSGTQLISQPETCPVLWTSSCLSTATEQAHLCLQEMQYKFFHPKATGMSGPVDNLTHACHKNHAFVCRKSNKCLYMIARDISGLVDKLALVMHKYTLACGGRNIKEKQEADREQKNLDTCLGLYT